MLKKIILILFLLMLIPALYFIPKKQTFEFTALGSVPFKIILEKRSSYSFRNDKKEILKIVNELENIFSSKLPGSELGKVNNKLGVETVVLSGTLNNVILSAINISKETEGAFDISVKPLINFWIDASKNNKIPTREQVMSVKKRVGFNLIRLSDMKIHSSIDGVMLDLGGIAKGTIVDALVNYFVLHGVKSGIVDAGGDIKVFGDKKYLVGIIAPENNGEVVARLECKNSAVVTSGNYERYSIIEGKKFSHIIDPKTGYPLSDTNTSFTVVAGDTETADAFATAFMVLGVDKSKEFLKKSDRELGIVAVTKDKNTFLIESMLDNTDCELVDVQQD